METDSDRQAALDYARAATYGLADNLTSLARAVDGVAQDFTVSYLFGQHRRGRDLGPLRDYLATKDDRLLTELAAFGGWLAAEASNAKGKSAR